MRRPLNETIFCNERELVKNEHGVFLYVSKDGKDAMDVASMLEDYKEWLIEKKVVKLTNPATT